MDPRYWYYVLRPQFPGKIGCGMRLTRSHRRTEDKYRGEKACKQRAIRTQFRRSFSRVDMIKGERRRIWKAGTPSFKTWLQEQNSQTQQEAS